MKTSTTEPERLMTLADLANYLHLGRKTVLKLVTDKQIPGMLIDGEWRFRRKDIDEWLDAQLSQPNFDFEEVPDGMSLPLGDLLPAEAVVQDMRAKDALGAIEELAARAYTQKWLNDKPWFIGALVERETLASTAMEGGVAFLHTRSRDTRRIARPFIVVGRSYNGLDFGAPDGKLTFLFFLLGLKYDRLHLPILGRLARLMTRNRGAIAKLRATTSAVKIRDMLLQLDSEELAIQKTVGVDYKRTTTEVQPQLDREVRLRAIMQAAKRKEPEAKRARAKRSAQGTTRRTTRK